MANPKRPPSREVRRLREELRRLMERWDAVIRRGTELERDLAQGLAQLRESRAAETLREIPVTQAEHPDGAIRTAALEKAGIHTMAEVLGYSRKELVEIPGFGETSAERILDAADRMLEAARQSGAGCTWGQDDPAALPVLRTVYRGSAGASHGGAGCRTGRGTPQPCQGAGTGIPACQRIFPVAVCLPSPAGTGRGGSGGHPGPAGE